MRSLWPALHLLSDGRSLYRSICGRTSRYALLNREAEGAPQPLSLYVPFCDTICYYCACNKVVTKDHGRSAKYIRYRGKEICLLSARVNPEAPVKQLHWGGGTPTFLSADEMTRLMRVLRDNFMFDHDAELSIEIEPRKVSSANVALLARLGFNRMSLGVQDFDPEVQKAVNRVQSEAETRVVLDAAPANGFRSINVDLVHGLPRQTVPGFGMTGPSNPGGTGPNRAVQRRARSASVQDAAANQRIRIAAAGRQACDPPLAIDTLTGTGYVYIGMDHFGGPTTSSRWRSAWGSRSAISRAP